MKRIIVITMMLLFAVSAVHIAAYADGNSYETLSVGNYGTAVKEMQKRLAELNYLNRSGIDGSYGKGTENAVVKFQKAAGLPETGIADNATQMALFSKDAPSGPDFTFTTTDRNGKQWDESMFSGYELIMINFWEPWCPPCVREMPDLEKLYENYKDKGFLLLGVYSSTNREAEVKGVLKDAGTTYPILKYTGNFNIFKSGYVPTTVFIDRNGHVLYPELTEEELNKVAEDILTLGSDAYTKYNALYVGSNSYEGWSSIIDKLL